MVVIGARYVWVMNECKKFMVEKAILKTVDRLLKNAFLKKDESDIIHFLLVANRDSMEFVRIFRCEKFEIARCYLRDDEYLFEKDKYIEMYEILWWISR